MKAATKDRLILSITWILRILVGLTFTFSGFVKAVDPWGTLYKFQDYMVAMGLPCYDNLLLVGVFALCAYEFCVGVFLLTGCFRKSTPIAAALMMCVMLPLTLWIAIANPVDDCGCFGEAIKLSNWATFGKNVVLTGAIVWLIKFNKRCRCLIRPFVQWIAILASVGYVVIIGLLGYFYQPLLDFRPFAIGVRLVDENNNENIESDTDDDEIDGEAYDSDEDNDLTVEYRFVYAKDGVEKIYSLSDKLPDEQEGWTFVRREEIASTEGSSKIKDDAPSEESLFRVWSEDGNDDVTHKALRTKGGEILLLMPDLKNVSIATTWQINSLYLWCKDNDIDMIGVVAATTAEIENWRDISMATYPIYTAEDTILKMLARGNPAVVYLKDGHVVWKSSLRALNTDDFQSSESLKMPESYARDNMDILKKVTFIYILVLILLVFMSLLPLLGRYLPSKVRNKIEARDAKITEKEKENLERVKSKTRRNIKPKNQAEPE